MYAKWSPADEKGTHNPYKHFHDSFVLLHVSHSCAFLFFTLYWSCLSQAFHDSWIEDNCRNKWSTVEYCNPYHVKNKLLLLAQKAKLRQYVWWFSWIIWLDDAYGEAIDSANTQVNNWRAVLSLAVTKIDLNGSTIAMYLSTTISNRLWTETAWDTALK